MQITHVPNDMPQWPPTTRLYVDENGQHYAVHVDEGMPGVLASVVAGLPADIQAGLHNIMICHTTVVLCDENGVVSSLDVFHASAPGTPHRIALQELGFDVVEES